MSYSILPQSNSGGDPIQGRYPGLPWSSASPTPLNLLHTSPTQAAAHKLRALLHPRALALSLLCLLLGGLVLGSSGGGTQLTSTLGSYASLYAPGWAPSQRGRQQVDNTNLLEPNWTEGADGLLVSLSSLYGAASPSLKNWLPHPLSSPSPVTVIDYVLLLTTIYFIQRQSEVYPSDLNPFRRANAALVVLVRNIEKEKMIQSMISLERRFNSKNGYPWVMLNNEPFSDDFKRDISRQTRHEVIFGEPPRHRHLTPSAARVLTRRPYLQLKSLPSTGPTLTRSTRHALRRSVKRWSTRA